MKKLLAALVLSLSFALPMTWAADDPAAAPAPAPAVTAPASEGAAPAVEATEPAAPAPAAEEAEAKEDEGSVMPTVFEGIYILLGILGLAIATLVTVLVKRLAAKFGIKLSDEQLELARKLAEQGIHYASSKAKAASEKPAGESKLKMAVDYIKGHPEFVKLAKKYSDEKLVNLIESTLDVKKTAGVDA